MVAKINRSTSLYGAVIYNQRKVDASTARIIYGNRMITDVTGHPERIMQRTLMAFENYLLANRNTEKPVLHISLNPTPEDSQSDSLFAQLAADYMRKMGYGDQPYIVYLHEDTGRRHIHIVSTCVNERGEKIDDAYEWKRSMKACRELERKFGLKQVEDKRKELTEPCLKKADYSRGDVKHQMANILKGVFSAYRFHSFGEYSALLSCFNIEAKQIKGEHGGVPYRGIVYTVTDDCGKPVAHRSSPRCSASVSVMKEWRSVSHTMPAHSKRRNGSRKYGRTLPSPCTVATAAVRSSSVCLRGKA